MSINVIASEAKQSISPRKEGMDCFVASAPRNDVVRISRPSIHDEKGRNLHARGMSPNRPPSLRIDAGSADHYLGPFVGFLRNRSAERGSVPGSGSPSIAAVDVDWIVNMVEKFSSHSNFRLWSGCSM